MGGYSCYIYKEGKDFFLTEDIAALARKQLASFVVRDKNGNLQIRPELCPKFFYNIDIPDTTGTIVSPQNEAKDGSADLFIFPYDLGVLRNFLSTDHLNQLFARLSFISGREKRHIVFDNSDLSDYLNLPLCQFKASAPSNAPDNIHSLWYYLHKHITDATPNFDLSRIKYDCAFRGVGSNILRKAAVLSLQRQSALKCDCALFNDMHIEGNTIIKQEISSTEDFQRKKRYVSSMQDSLLILCPPGVGMQSIRFYETLYFGRIPVLFDIECRYPYMDEINYEEFCLFIPPAEVMHTGEIIYDWLKAHSKDELYTKCVRSRKTWINWFNNSTRLHQLANLAIKYCLK